MFEIEIVLCDDMQSEVISKVTGNNLTSLKDEISGAILNSVHESGCYNAEIIITEDCEYFDTDETNVFVDVENKIVTYM